MNTQNNASAPAIGAQSDPRQENTVFVAANRAAKVYCYLAGSWPFDCWEGVKSAACLGIMLPDGKRADYIAHAATPDKMESAMRAKGYALCA